MDMVSDFPQFLTDMQIQTSTWANEGLIEMDYLPFIIRAFQGRNQTEDPSDLLQDLEAYALKYHKSMTPIQASNMIIYHGQWCKDPELSEVCEKIAVRGYTQICEVEGYS